MDLLEATVQEKKRVFSEWHEAIRKVLSKAEQELSIEEKGQFSGAQKAINEIKEKDLPKVLVDFEMGRCGAEKVRELWTRLHDAEEVISTRSFLLAGLKIEKRRLEASQEQFGHIEQQLLKPYRDLKAEILKTGLAKDRIDRLGRLAKTLSAEWGDQALEDWEAFLECIKQGGKAKP